MAGGEGGGRGDNQRPETRERAAEARGVATPSTQLVGGRTRRVAGAAASSPLSGRLLVSRNTDSGTGAHRQRRLRAALVSVEPVALNSALGLALTYRQLKSL